jgi:hypothetical protein
MIKFVKQTCSRLMDSYDDKLHRDAESKQQELDRRRAAGIKVEEPEPLPAAPPSVEGMSKRAVWEVEIVDEKLIPREYLMVDMDKLRKFAAATSGEIPVAGVKFSKHNTFYGNGKK